MRQVELLHGAATDVGRVRQVNEDAYLVAAPVFVVADGMGGHADGSVASRIVVEEFGRLATTGYDATRGPDTVAEVLRVCQDRITSHPVDPSVPLGRTPGTTVVAALLVEDAGAPAWLLVNLGDSRIYRVSRGRLQQVSSDHSVVQELIDAGQLRPEDAAQHPDRHVITRALGGPRLEEADYFVLPLAGADRLLLCSDGVSGLVDDEGIAQVLGAHPDPQEAAGALVAAALAAGGDDNATAVVVDVVGWEPEQRTSGDGGA
ncbi:PP2C family protein-serine/threonine phosphatase [Nocardioides flavescens]|uniref:Serine/threonine-protein phosphatase n=1 Tax=Nocardioides flavescens TaxID=2691959 RepID=A0A6L7F143_9ACTN|nr:protein phosphatase 2C domain-containing protein [Nocardioides flavescens]MXG90431.1 serine/threonine-protein phosphatase [Nocardioides flavescens]